MSQPDRVEGAADAQATAKAVEALGPHGTAPLGRTGLVVSRLGFGGYRVDDAHAVFADALRRALESGCNLIDTSTNYADGGSERCVGAVLGSLFSQGRRRSEIVVVSKIGYVQGQNLDLAMERERVGRPFPEMVKYMEGCWHCIHPEFLADQLERSLGRLRLATLDVCLLHNPEYFFSDALHRGAGPGEIAGLRDEFYRRLEAAFAFFESQVAAGRIRFYGVSSNTCTSPVDDGEMTSLDRMWAAAEAAGGAGHHFGVLQLPMNLLEAGALLEANNGGRTVLERAAERGVGVLVNRPLNAISGKHLVRFAGALSRARAERAKPDCSSVRDRPRVAPLVDPALPAERHGATLSQKALHVLTSAPGVSCVLLGMRRPAYVDDALTVLGWPRLPAAAVRAAVEAFQR